MLVNCFLKIIILTGFYIISQTGFGVGKGGEPISQDELLALITTSQMGAISSEQVVKLINERGLGFSIKDILILELRERTVNESIIRAVRKQRTSNTKSSLGYGIAGTSLSSSRNSSGRQSEEFIFPNQMKWPEFLKSVRTKAMEYTENLPNFICTQITQRFLRRLPKKGWIKSDNFVAELSYYDQTEHYKLLSVANRAAKHDATLESLGGTSSKGEFGSTLNYLFNPKTQAVFRPEGIEKNKDVTTVRVGFKVPLSTSKRLIIYKDKEDEQSVVTAYRGRCWIDSESLQVVRIKEQAFKIPSNFPITRSQGGTVYDEVEIAGIKYWLPVRAEVVLETEVVLENGSAKIQTKNVIEFKRYRKFSSDVKFLPD